MIVDVIRRDLVSLGLGHELDRPVRGCASRNHATIDRSAPGHIERPDRREQTRARRRPSEERAGCIYSRANSNRTRECQIRSRGCCPAAEPLQAPARDRQTRTGLFANGAVSVVGRRMCMWCESLRGDQVSVLCSHGPQAAIGRNGIQPSHVGGS